MNSSRYFIFLLFLFFCMSFSYSLENFTCYQEDTDVLSCNNPSSGTSYKLGYFIYSNYSIPYNYQSATLNVSDQFGIHSHLINDSCLTDDILSVRIFHRPRLSNEEVGIRNTTIDCWNGSNYIRVFNQSGTGSDFVGTGNVNVDSSSFMFDGNWNTGASYTNTCTGSNYCKNFQTELFYEEGVTWTLNNPLSNCTDFQFQVFNYSFYRAIDTPTTADSKLNISCLWNSYIPISYLTYGYESLSTSVCSNQSTYNFTCSGYINYVSNWTNNYIYTYPLNSLFINHTTTYLNLSVPQLFLNFSSSTDVTIVDSQEEYYFEDTEILLSLSNLSNGKVSVIFNSGNQYYEYENDFSTFHDAFLEVIENPDTWINFIPQGENHQILPSTIINIYHLDNVNNATYLVSRLYGNEEKRVYLNSNNSYEVKAYLDDYTMDKDILTFTPNQLENQELNIIMKKDDTIDTVFFSSSHAKNIPSETDVEIEICVEGITTINTLQITWDIDTNGIDYTDIDTSAELFCYSRDFLTTDSNLTVVASGDSYSNTFFFEHHERTTRYEASYYGTLLTSQFAFIIFFILTIGISLSIHEKYKNYGIISAMVVSSFFSFLNLWMLLVSVPLILSMIAKKNISEEL